MDIRRLSRVMSGKSDGEEPEVGENTPSGFIDDNEETGIDISKSAFANLRDENESGRDKDDENNSENDEFEDDLEEDYLDSPSVYSSPSSTINQYQSIESAQQGFDIIAGINDIPTRYRDENLIPELVAPSIQYNRIKGNIAQAEWQIKRRSLIRKHQMYRPDYQLDERDIAGYGYINDLLLSRADDGFERKMSNNSLSGVYQENASESAPSSPRRRGSLFGGMFGGGDS